MEAKTKASDKLEAKEAIVVVVGARPIQWQKKIVRDRHTGKLVEIDLHEAPPVDEGDEGTPYVFKRGEQVWADHPAVKACPSAFVPIGTPRRD
jgi:hypothetical protein